MRNTETDSATILVVDDNEANRSVTITSTRVEGGTELRVAMFCLRLPNGP